MRWYAIALIMLVGCTSPPQVDVSGDPTNETAGQGDYWLVYIEGEEERDPPSTVMCSVVWAYDIDLQAETIRYADDEYTQNQVGDAPKTIIAASVWDASSCPVAYRVTDAGSITIQTNGMGDVEVRIDDDGTVHVAGETLQPGQEARLSGSDTHAGPATYTTEITVRALGAWSLDGLQAGQQ